MIHLQLRLGIEPRIAHQLPVTGLARPTGWVVQGGLLVDTVALLQNFLVTALTTVSWRHIADGTVAALFVVPANELQHPRASGPQAGEPSIGYAGWYLQVRNSDSE